jgi:hypothetical protein
MKHGANTNIPRWKTTACVRGAAKSRAIGRGFLNVMEF